MYARKVKLIVTLSVVTAVMLALIITNFFIPVIYFTAYVHFKKDVNPAGIMRIRYIDVGFGDCTLCELPDGKTMLIDGGVGTYSNVYKLLDILNGSGIDRIDYLFCTSVKSEHCGALAEIAKYKEIKTAYIPLVTNDNLTDEYAAFKSELTRRGTELRIADFGEGKYSAEYGYFFMVMSPSAAELPECEYNAMNEIPNEYNINSASVVLWLQYAGRAFMFLSDASAYVQSGMAGLIRLQQNKFIVDGNNVTLSRCTVLKAPNHCAEGYTDTYLYDIVQPEAAVLSVGKNAKSCPSNTDIANLQLYVGNKLYRTDIHGTVTATVSSTNYSISKEK